MSIVRTLKPQVLAALVLAIGALPATAGTLQDIEVQTLPGDQVVLRLKLDGPAPTPMAFTIDNPARIAIDLMDTSVGLKERRKEISVGQVRSVSAAEAQGRTRVVVNLAGLIAYDARAEGNTVVLTLGASQVAGAAAGAPAVQGARAAAPRERRVENIDFRRGDLGEGRIIVKLSDPSTPVSVREESSKIYVDFGGATIPPNLMQRYDVVDFATPVRTIDATRDPSGTRLVIQASGKYEQLAYQSDNMFTLEVKPPQADPDASPRDKEYTGDRLTLNFQDIETRAVLQIIADFTSMNVVVSDAVKGNVTLRLQNVPWDQALDLILKSKGLGMRSNGNVVLIAPAAEIAEREKQELESQRKVEELSNLRAEFVQINYAKAAEMLDLLKSKDNSLLSARGNVSVDARTNTLLVMDTEERLADIRRMIRRLDVPVRQVLIESRVVVASDDFSRELGARLGLTGNHDQNGGWTAGGTTVYTSGTSNGTVSWSNFQNAGTDFPISDGFNVNLPVAQPAGSIAFAIVDPNYRVDLELSAAQAEGRGEVVSSPRVVAANQREAIVEQGVEIPYTEASSSGATTVNFKKAVLSLKVTPQITPDDRVIMDLEVKKDTIGQNVPSATGGFIPSIDTREINTQVLVDNGQTVVLGGIYETERGKSVTKVPLLGDIPGLGILFRQTLSVNNKAELLIFVTPKIIKESVALNQ
jgi:type IV pilus assembly protein PilQ